MLRLPASLPPWWPLISSRPEKRCSRRWADPFPRRRWQASRCNRQRTPLTSIGRWSFLNRRTGASLARQYRVARRLAAARFVELHMLSATAGTWPTKFRPDNLLALYDADGTAYSNSTLLERADHDHQSTSRKQFEVLSPCCPRHRLDHRAGPEICASLHSEHPITDLKSSA